MGMTITEKIIAKHAGVDSVKPGEIVQAHVDLAMSNDVTAPLAIKELEKFGIHTVFDPKKVCLVPDHWTPQKDIKSAEACKIMREYVAKQNIEHYFEIGRMGIEHALLPEQGLVAPGELIVGGDSHTCTYGALGAFSSGMGSTDIASAMALGTVWLRVPETIKCVFNGKLNPYITGKDLILWLIGRYGVDGAQYKTLEVSGTAISELTMDDRFCMCSMGIEAGAKNEIIHVDDKTRTFLEGRINRPYEIMESDADAKYCDVWEFNVTELYPLVSMPFSPDNTCMVKDLEKVRVDQVILGSCTNGRLEDLRRAASIMKGKKVASAVRMVVLPATQEIYKQAMKEGLLETFIDAGAAVSTPTCGPCCGGNMGVLASGEVCCATTNRNFRGRMGAADSLIYLASPYVAAATAIAGHICEPKEVL